MLSNTVLMCAVIVLACLMVGRWLYKKDTQIEARRKAAGRLAAACRAKKLSVVPDFLECYSVGDYSGMAKAIDKLIALLEHDPDHLEQMLDQAVDNVIAARKAGLTSDTALAAAKAVLAKAQAVVDQDANG